MGSQALSADMLVRPLDDVGVVLAAVAGVVALTGKKKVQQAMPPVPQDSVESVKEDVQWTKTRAQQGRR